MEYIFDKEVVVATSDKSYDDIGWGPYQFPEIFNINGILYLEFHTEADSSLSYGKDKAHYISYDLGETWEETNLIGGVKLKDNTIIKPVVKPPIYLKDVLLPKPIYKVKIYNFDRYVYDEKDISPLLSKWYGLKGKIGHLNEYEISVNHNNFCRYTSEGVFPTNFFLRFYIDKEDNIWALQQRFLVDAPKNNHALFYKSTDNGKTFNLFSKIYYDEVFNDYGPNVTRVGFAEQSLTFIDKKNAFSLLRTTDGYKVSPLYISYSSDGAKTWTYPTIFDNLGVWPNVVSLNNGAHIASYGRPGLFIRGLYNNKWDKKRTTLIAPLKLQQDTCSYSATTTINDDTFIIAYSDFQHKISNGDKRKAIITRKIKVKL